LNFRSMPLEATPFPKEVLRDGPRGPGGDWAKRKSRSSMESPLKGRRRDFLPPTAGLFRIERKSKGVRFWGGGGDLKKRIGKRQSNFQKKKRCPNRKKKENKFSGGEGRKEQKEKEVSPT